MQLFGLNISVSRNQKSKIEIQKSFDPSAWLRGEDSPDPRPVLSNAYQQCVWVYRAVNAVAEQVANIPFLFSRGERGRESLITSGPLLDFYNRPHPQINRFQYWELRIIWLMLRGESFRIPIYQVGTTSTSSPSSLSFKNQKSKIKNIVYLDPSHFHHIIVDHQLAGWRYTGFGPNAPLEAQIFLPEEVWH